MVLGLAGLVVGCNSASEDTPEAKAAGKTAGASRKEAQKEQSKAKHKGRAGNARTAAPEAPG